MPQHHHTSSSLLPVSAAPLSSSSATPVHSFDAFNHALTLCPYFFVELNLVTVTSSWGRPWRAITVSMALQDSRFRSLCTSNTRTRCTRLQATSDIWASRQEQSICIWIHLIVGKSNSNDLVTHWQQNWPLVFRICIESSRHLAAISCSIQTHTISVWKLSVWRNGRWKVCIKSGIYLPTRGLSPYLRSVLQLLILSNCTKQAA